MRFLSNERPPQNQASRPYSLRNNPRISALRTLTLSASVILVGCSSSPRLNPSQMGYTASPAAAPQKVQESPRIADALQCIRNTGALKRVVFGVGPWVDSTGKINAVAQGATGAFLPQAGTASFVTDAIRKAGGQVLVQYFGKADVKVRPRYAINGIFNSLDFGTHIDADVRVAGIGPSALSGWAQLTLTVQLDHASTRMNRQVSVITRAVRYTRMGVSTGKVFNGTLVTGGVQFHDQQRLQFEAVNGPIAMGVIAVIAKEFPSTARCRNKLMAQFKAYARPRKLGARSKPKSSFYRETFKQE